MVEEEEAMAASIREEEGETAAMAASIRERGGVRPWRPASGERIQREEEDTKEISDVRGSAKDTWRPGVGGCAWHVGATDATGQRSVVGKRFPNYKHGKYNDHATVLVAS